MPTVTTEPTETEPPATAVPSEGEGEGDGEVEAPVRVPGPLDLLFGLLGVGVVAGGSYYYVARTEPWLGTQVRCALVAAVGGLVGYNYIALGLPGSAQLMASLQSLAGLLMAVVGGVGAVALYAGWLSVEEGAMSEEGGGDGDERE